MIGMVDASLSTKFTVQFNLFGGTLNALSTERHLPFLRTISSLKNMGCFCLTELGYGNNAPKMETTSVYDVKSQTFTINTPSTLGQKFWITNGACHANYAVVFAQTIVAGVNEGINAFIVRIRDDNMKPCKGVFIEDMGMKMGLNGIDNGRLMFTDVVIDREAMLNKNNDVTPDGKFISETKKVSQRFFKVADRLLSGRLCISAMTLSGTKAALFTAIRYSQQRLAVGPNGKSNTPIMSFQLQQNAILPALCRTIVLNLGYNRAKDMFEDPSGVEHEQIRTYCAIKTMVTWNMESCAAICRERCGGGSFLSSSLIPEAVVGSHSGMTAEGDNNVLMQKAVKDIMADMQKDMHAMPELTMCPKRQIPALKSVANLDVLVQMIYYREQAVIESFQQLMAKKIMEDGQAFFDVWMYQVSDEIQTLALAFGERFCLENAMKDLNKMTHTAAKDALRKAIFLHCVTLVRNNQAWYLINEVISTEAAAELDDLFNAAVKDVVPHLNVLVEALGLPDIPALHAPIVRDHLAFNAQDDNENFEAAGPLFDFRQTGALGKL